MLNDQQLFDPHLPIAWRDVLDDLREFLALRGQLQEQETAAGLARFRALHDSLVDRSAALLEPDSLADVPSAELHRILLRAVLALVHLKQSVIGDQPVLDTAGSRTLALFEADFFGTARDVEQLIEAVRIDLRLSPADVAEAQRTLAMDLADAQRKQALVGALRKEFALRAGASELRDGIARLFFAIYPHAPIVPDEIELVVTSTLVFFCLPLTHEGDALTTERFARLPADEQAEVRGFLQSLKKFTQERFATFPAFGLVDCEKLDEGLVNRLAAQAGVAPAVILKELPRLVTILPLAEIDKYLIHDVWGHGWQASMLRYDDLYERLARFADPLSLDGELADCFIGSGVDLRLDEDRFRAAVVGEVGRRLPIALSAVLAEMMADVAEFKFLAEHPELVAWLPSSSRLSAYPSMLDLTLADIPFYFGQATKAFRLLAKQASRQERLIADLVARGADHAGAARCVARVVEIWHELDAETFAADLRYAERDGRLVVNAYTRIMLNFLGLHRAILDAYKQLDAAAPGTLPLKSFRDLLVLAASVFFEADPERHLWRLDEFLALIVTPFCRRIAEHSA